MQVNQNNQTNYHNTYMTPPMDMSPTQWEGEVQQAQPGHNASYWSMGQGQPQSMGMPQGMIQPMGLPQSTGSTQTTCTSRTTTTSQSTGAAPQTMGMVPQTTGAAPQAMGAAPQTMGMAGQPQGAGDKAADQGQDGTNQQTQQIQFMEQFGRGGEARMARWRAALTFKPLDMTNGLSQDAIENPMSREEVFLGGLKGLLSKNLGHYVIATFIVGVQNFVVWRGVLESVGNDYLVIYQPNQDSHVSCDFYSLKFIEFPNSYETIWNYSPGQEQK